MARKKGVPKKVRQIARAIEREGTSPGSAYRIAWATYHGTVRRRRKKGKK